MIDLCNKSCSYGGTLMPTIRDIAKKAGVSPASVSLVLNNKECRLSEETRQRILQCARELNYENKNMSFKFTDSPLPVIGIIVPDLSNPFYSTLCMACQQEAHRNGYHTIFTSIEDAENPEHSFLGTFLAQKLNGVVYIQTAETAEVSRLHICQEIQRARIPLVTSNKVTSDTTTPAVISDHFYGGYLATRHLLELGHRIIGCISGPDNPICRERLRGYQKALEEFHVPFRSELIYEGDYFMQSGYQALAYMRGQHVTAIFSLNDMMALGVYQAVRAYDLTVPDDISVVGYDDIFVTDLLDPPLTSVSQDTHGIGVQAVRLLLRIIHKEPDTQNVILTPSLQVRRSTAKPKA